MLSMIFGFLASIKTVIIGAVKWCVNTVGSMIMNNLIGVQSPN